MSGTKSQSVTIPVTANTGAGATSLRALGQLVPRGLLVAVVSTMLALAIGLVVIALTGASVKDAVDAFWDGVAGSAYGIGSSINRASVYVLVGLGFVFANRANLTNVGGEGQIAMGGLFATAIALHGALALPSPFSYLLPLLVGSIAGAVWGGLAGFLRVARGTNEVISTLLLSFIALPIVYGAVQSEALLRQPITPLSSLPQSLPIAESTRLPMLLPHNLQSPLNAGLILVAIVTVLVGLVLKKGTLGVELQAVGSGEAAARKAGIATRSLIVMSLAVSGALGGLAGAIMIQGTQYYLASGFSSGYGWDGLVVGLLARGSVIGVVLGALLFGFLRSGSIAVQITAGVPSQLVDVIQGLIVIAIASSAILIERATR
jgi:ABC-type uncharacterized transport system permease subunit